MRKLTYFSILASCLLLVTSCSINKSIMVTPSATINKPNFRIIKTVVGKAETKHVLGFGGLNNNGLGNEAKANLYKNAELKTNQTIANATLDQKTTLYFFWLYWKEEVIMSADVVEFLSENNKGNNEQSTTNSSVNDKTEVKQVELPIAEESALVTSEESAILKLVKGKNFVEGKYNTVDEIAKGDYVKITTDFGEFIYAKVIDATNPKKVSVKYYTQTHNPLFWEVNWKDVLKITPLK